MVYMDLCTELFFPIIYTATGAVIGGLFAYVIARGQFAHDYINQGKAYTFAIRSASQEIIGYSEDLQNYINSSTEYDAEEFLPVLFNKNKILESRLTVFVLDWDRCREKLWFCTMRHICKRPSDRKRYKKIYEKANSTYNTIIDYQSLAKKYMGIFKHDDATGKTEHKEFYGTQESHNMLQSAVNFLRRIEVNCSEIVELCDEFDGRK